MTLAFSRLTAIFVGLFCVLGVAESSAVVAQQGNARHSHHGGGAHARYFHRLATFPVHLNTDIKRESVAEILASTADGRRLLYTDSATQSLGFVDLSTPTMPLADGVVALAGAPTSVAVHRRWALVVVNTSVRFTEPSGALQIVDINRRTVVRDIELGGQPDSIAVSPDGRYAAIAIENERDEDLGDGAPPQAPAGFVVIVDLWGPPSCWSTREVSLNGVATLFPDDPEPEYVAINRGNIAAVTLQENNHIVLIDLPSGRIVDDWSTGVVNLTGVDAVENDLIELSAELNGVPREPDAVTWLDRRHLVTADEGDLDGGGRGFTLFSKRGRIRHQSGNTLAHLLTRIGHYPEGRSENKGVEPEGVASAYYGREQLLFVGAERAGAVAVYHIKRSGWHGRPVPLFKQVLPTGMRPEGLLPIPQRGLFAVASEKDKRKDKFRSVITLYGLGHGPPSYPTIVSTNRANGTPIPWGALSALAVDRRDANIVYAAHDGFYTDTRIFTLDIRRQPAVIIAERPLYDEDGPVDFDIEGLTVRSAGGYWLVSEGAGNADDRELPIVSLNQLLRVSADGRIEEIVSLPDTVNASQRQFGFEGVAAIGHGDQERIYVAFQREWLGDDAGLARIGVYRPATGTWAFYHYPLDTPRSPNGGWVGISELVALDDQTLAILERDNQAGGDARIKRIYSVPLAGAPPMPVGNSLPVLSKTLVRDLLPDLAATGGAILEKVEGMAMMPWGEILIVTDNDGADDASGETQLLRLR